MQTPITIEKLNSLNDKEILVFNLILKHYKYKEICRALDLPYASVNYIMNAIYKKLEIQVKKSEHIRAAWRISVDIEKQKVGIYRPFEKA